METLLTEKDLVKLTGLSRSYFAIGRMKGYGPPYLKLKGAVRYRQADVEAWFEESRVDRREGVHNGA